MPVQHQEITASVTLVTTAETAVASFQFGQLFEPPTPGAAVPVAPTIVTGVLNVTAGTSTTAVVIRVRQGIGTGGAVVGNADTHTLAAGASANIPVKKEDLVGASAYTVTVTQTAATGNGSVNSASIDVDQNLTGGT